MRAFVGCALLLGQLLLVAGCIEPYDLGADAEPWPYFFGPEATCALDAVGDFQCVGVYEFGRLAIGPMDFTDMCGSRVCTSVFEDSMLNSPADVALGHDFGCFAIADGVQCSGRNAVGQLGREPRFAGEDAVVRYVDVDFHPVQVEAGLAHVCALSEQAGVFCWGLGNHGQLGQDTSLLDDCGAPSADDRARFHLDDTEPVRCSATPLALAGFMDVVDLALTDFGTCLLRSSGQVRCFGLDAQGALGLGATVARVDAPTALDLPPVVSLVSGSTHVLAQTASGEVYVWGENGHGQLADVPSDDCAGQPCVARPTRWAVDASRGAALGLATTYLVNARNELRSVGRDDVGQLGRGGARDVCDGVPCSRRLGRVDVPRHVIHVGAGTTHACAELSDHRTFCWGAGDAGQTGDPLHENSAVPTALAPPVVR